MTDSSTRSSGDTAEADKVDAEPAVNTHLDAGPRDDVDLDDAEGAEDGGVTEEEVLQAFVTQACFGVLLGLQRSWESRPAAEKAAAPVMSATHFLTASSAFLALYLNDCYMHLLHEDDEYLMEVFALLSHESPYCVLAYLFALGGCVFQRLDPQSILAVEEEDTEHAGVNDNRIHSAVSAAAAEVVSESFQKLEDGEEGDIPSHQATLGHDCDQPDLTALMTDWIAEGRPDVQLFRVV